MSVRISVVIPVLDQWPLTENCLRSLAITSPPGLEIIVVDNNSTDETPQACPILGRELFGTAFRYLRQQMNLGFGQASNLGAAQAKGDLLFLLNNDTEVRPGWLEPLTATLAHPAFGAVGPRLLYPNGRIQHIGIVFTPMLAPTHLFEHFPGNHPATAQTRVFQAITAAAMLVPLRLFRELGGFYPQYQNGYEDIDLCARIRARELRIGVNPESVIIHHTSQSAGRFDHDAENATLLRSRQAHAFIPDLHTFGERSGYALHIDSALSAYLTLPESKAKKLETREWSREGLVDMLAAEPLWEEGYDHLADTLEQEGEWLKTLPIRLLAVQLFPNETNYRALFRTAYKSGNTRLAGQAEQKLAVFRDMSKQNLRRLATHAAIRARKNGDRVLAEIFEKWIARQSIAARTPSPTGSPLQRKA